MHYDRESFITTISELKEMAFKNNVTLTDEQIAKRLGISIEQFDAYIKENFVSPDIFKQLRSTFFEYLGGKEYHEFGGVDEWEDNPPYVPPPNEDE